jgi:hypothetical protein
MASSFERELPLGGPGQPNQPQQQQRPVRRRMRMITSCLECRRRKLRCDKSQPCGNCTRFGRECPYLSPQLDEAGQLRLLEFKEKLGSLESRLRDTGSGGSDSKKTTPSTSRQQKADEGRAGVDDALLADAVDDRRDDDEAAGLAPTDLAAVDIAYDDDAEGGADDVVDLGVLVGRMRITERVGGMSRPRLSEEVRAALFSRPR